MDIDCDRWIAGQLLKESPLYMPRTDPKNCLFIGKPYICHMALYWYWKLRVGQYLYIRYRWKIKFQTSLLKIISSITVYSTILHDMDQKLPSLHGKDVYTHMDSSAQKCLSIHYEQLFIFYVALIYLQEVNTHTRTHTPGWALSKSELAELCGHDQLPN